MSRQRCQIGEYLYIIVRGIGKQIIFENDSDRISGNVKKQTKHCISFVRRVKSI